MFMEAGNIMRKSRVTAQEELHINLELSQPESIKGKSETVHRAKI